MGERRRVEEDGAGDAATKTKTPLHNVWKEINPNT